MIEIIEIIVVPCLITPVPCEISWLQMILIVVFSFTAPPDRVELLSAQRQPRAVRGLLRSKLHESICTFNTINQAC